MAEELRSARDYIAGVSIFDYGLSSSDMYFFLVLFRLNYLTNTYIDVFIEVPSKGRLFNHSTNTMRKRKCNKIYLYMLGYERIMASYR